jgi:hypothetical protein
MDKCKEKLIPSYGGNWLDFLEHRISGRAIASSGKFASKGDTPREEWEKLLAGQSGQKSDAKVPDVWKMIEHAIALSLGFG